MSSQTLVAVLSCSLLELLLCIFLADSGDDGRKAYIHRSSLALKRARSRSPHTLTMKLVSPPWLH